MVGQKRDVCGFPSTQEALDSRGSSDSHDTEAELKNLPPLPSTFPASFRMVSNKQTDPVRPGEEAFSASLGPEAELLQLFC